MEMKKYLICVTILIYLSIQLYAKPLLRSRVKRLAHRDRNRLWPKGVVPYTIDGAFSSKERIVIKLAMKNIESVSCIRFRKRTWEEGYVDIRKPAEVVCSATIGYQGNRQSLNLASACVEVGTVTHELFHSLGFEHEHTRPDRHNYIKIHTDNIHSDKLHNFNQKSMDEYTSFGLPYDYNSIMHYTDTAFSKHSSRKAFKRIGSNSGIPEPKVMSKIDIKKLNRHYRCPRKKT